MVVLRLFRVAMMALALAGLAFLYVFSVASAEGAPRPRPRPVRQGFAVTADGYDFRHKEAFLIYEHRARADEKGLWKQVGGKQPAAPLSAAEGK